MKLNAYQLCVAIFVLATLSSAHCRRPCLSSNYTFGITDKVNPNLDSIHIGDTLFIISNIPTTMNDLISGKIIDYSGAKNLSADISISEMISGIDTGRGATSDFNYVSINGSIYLDNSIPKPTYFMQLKYQQTGNSYLLNVGIIPKRNGIYSLGLGNGLNISTTTGCDKTDFQIAWDSTTNQHFYLHDLIYPGNPLSDFSKTRVYCFKVY
ncbi:MAG TPA: hypothetical protein VGG71_16355 [Chitinophagaceae bacterium]